MGARGSSRGTGALTRDTGGTTTGSGTLRSRASIGTGGSRTASLAGGSVETTPFVVGNGAGGSGAAASFENASAGASLIVGKTAGGSGAAGSFEGASGSDVGSSAVASLGASAGTISLAVGNGAGGSGTATSLAYGSAISPRPGNSVGGSSMVASFAGTTALTVGGTTGSRVAVSPLKASVEAAKAGAGEALSSRRGSSAP